MFGPGNHWNFFEIWGALASWMAGIVLFIIWLAVVLLFVRFLLIATRAAKVYLRNHGEHDGLLPNRPAAPATPAAATTTRVPPTKPAPRAPRPPKP